MKPSIWPKEIYVKLLKENICAAGNVPSVRTSQYGIENMLEVTYKILTYKPEQLYMFDKAWIIRTDSNQKWGQKFCGEPAVG